MNGKPELKTDPGRDPERRAHQAQVKYAILENQAWGLTYLLTRVKDRAPYRNYRVPSDLDVFEFTVKGVVRLEMMAQEGYRGWRRMFGSNTKARELSTWRSRALIKAFASLDEARAYLEADPLVSWEGGAIALPDDLPPDDWYVLFQIQDVWLPGGEYRWSDLLEIYLRNDSRLMAFAGRCEVLPPVEAKEGDNA
jgi:hypothetical protein